MKRKNTFLLASCGLLAAAAAFFLWVERQYAAPVPVPSVPGGYYEEEFTLQFTPPPHGKIYFSTDGSIPTVNSQLYVDGIEIKDRSREPNVYNSIQNVVKDWKNFQPDETPVPKGTVVRAICVNPWGIQSEVMTQTYFVGIQPPERGYTVSLVFEDDDLFGENGIHVTGKEYDDWYLAGDLSVPEPLTNCDIRREVSVTAEIMSETGDILNQPAGLRIQGNSSITLPKKRLTLVSRREYSGSDLFDAQLFPGTSTHSVMFKKQPLDFLIADLVPDRSVATQKSVPVQVYFNGEYWYSSYMLERLDKQYFHQYFSVEDRVRAKNAQMDDDAIALFGGDIYTEFQGWAEDTDFSDSHAYESLLEMVDIQSFIDYISTNYYICNVDINDYANYLLWRSPHRGAKPYNDTRWRWCIFDVDAFDWVGYTEHTAQVNTFSNDVQYDLNGLLLFRAARRNPDFCRQFVLSFMDILNNNFAPARVEPVLRKYGYTLDWMDGFFRERPKYAVQHLAEEFQLTGSVETVSVFTDSPDMGTVTVNTSTLDLASGRWSGQYFTDYPITVTATAKPGFRFVGWRGDAEDSAPSLTLPVDGGLSLEAVFAPA